MTTVKIQTTDLKIKKLFEISFYFFIFLKFQKNEPLIVYIVFNMVRQNSVR
jgi:hypothetical protein